MLFPFIVSLSAKTRLAALESLRLVFSSRVLYDFLTERRLTVSDCLERSLKKGTFTQYSHSNLKMDIYLMKTSLTEGLARATVKDKF